MCKEGWEWQEKRYQGLMEFSKLVECCVQHESYFLSRSGQAIMAMGTDNAHGALVKSV